MVDGAVLSLMCWSNAPVTSDHVRRGSSSDSLTQGMADDVTVAVCRQRKGPRLSWCRGRATVGGSAGVNPDAAEALPRKASDEVLILRLARGPARKASNEVPILRLARGRLGSYPITTTSTRTSRPTNTTNHSRDVSRTMARHSGVTDEMGVVSTPCRSGQDGAGVIGCCAQHCAHD